jgi:hypothetical protein
MNFSCPAYIYISGKSHLYLSCNEIYRTGRRDSSSMNKYLILMARQIYENVNKEYISHFYAS